MDMRKQTWFILLVLVITAGATAQVTSTIELPPRPPVCPITTIYQGGVTDNFGGGPDPAVWSPALSTYLSNKPNKRYDDPACDRWVGQSFLISKGCICEGICSAELEVIYKSCGSSLACNDSIQIGQAPFGAGAIVSAQLYPPGCTTTGGGGTGPATDTVATEARKALTPGTTITKRFPIDVTKLKGLCAKSPGASFWLDVAIQDDTIVDSMKLIITHH